MIEASLGGKVTAGEVEVFGEEVVEVVSLLEGRPFNMLLDFSKAKGIDDSVLQLLGEVRDLCHELGAQKISSVVPNEQVMEHQISRRLNHVMGGQEEFILDSAYAQFTPFALPEEIRLAA